MGKMHDTYGLMRRTHRAGQLGLEVLIAFFTIAVAGCATPRPSPKPESKPILLEAKVVNTFGDSVMSENRRADPTLALGAIPGDIRGGPRRTLQFVHMSGTPTIAINADALSAKVQEELSRETDEFLISGLSVEPADTRFARISVALMKKGSPTYGMATGFINADSYDPMTLVYFDRPCRVTGTTFGDNGAPSPITYDADVKKAGLTWLVAIQQESGGEIVLVANASSPKMFVAAPADNLKEGRFQLR
jgi:hypothetical protein